MSEEFTVVEIPCNEKERYQALQDMFEEIYKAKVEYFARTPGRVNLIGEHLDYCGYAVLPMALEQDLIMAVCPKSDGRVCLANTSSEHRDLIRKTSNYKINKDHPEWHDYFMCGLKGITTQCNITSPVGMNILVTSTIPESAGLSSSSALVCSAAMSNMHSNRFHLTKVQLSEMAEYCENLIGTVGGGMDQAIAILAKPGTAQLIEFYPLKTTEVILPADAVFVISNSCSDIHKAANSHFNIRVVECRLACQVMAKKKYLNWKTMMKFKDLQTELGVSLTKMLELCNEYLHEQPYNKSEICSILGISAEELDKLTLLDKTFSVNEFRLYQRAKHVFSEAQRVWEFKEHCDNPTSDTLEKLGKLMYDSHESCRDWFDCSCQELDDLVDLAKSYGALGSRLTGAGWGGCVVSLVKSHQTTDFIAFMKDGYYAKKQERMEKVSEALFATHPSGGAALYSNIK